MGNDGEVKQQFINTSSFEDFVNEELPKKPVTERLNKLIPPVVPVVNYQVPFILL